MDTVSTADTRRQQHLSDVPPEILPFDAAGHDGGDDDTTPPASPAGANAMGLPCTRGKPADSRGRGVRSYSLCAVLILPDPDDVDGYYADGQELLPFASEGDAVAACERLADDPASLPRVGVPEVNYLVVNDDRGREVCRSWIGGGRVAA